MLPFALRYVPAELILAALFLSMIAIWTSDISAARCEGEMRAGILACPLMHILMHRGHDRRHDGRPHDPPKETTAPQAHAEQRRDPS